jgi:malonyl-CoA decarboxylase
LRRELPKLETFVTLSPVPGFMQWLKSEDAPATDEERTVISELDRDDWFEDTALAEQMRRPVEALVAHYFLKAKRADGKPIDAVARFHLGNGARLERIHWLGDRSTKGMRESAGFMVSYLYDLDEIEKNHEAYANQGAVATSNAVRKLLKADPKIRFGLPTAASLSFG